MIYKSTINNMETVITLPVAEGIYSVRLISKENRTATWNLFISR
ncbi:MAG: hypothetical protein FWF70_00880 [Bacteroidetes bacterium]|nr:hypothetical protein [Bacteroidota bacterium]MCL1969240.1 hypothetical protein [Bacteroidota bacterium]